VIQDGVELARYDKIGMVSFSPDSRYLAFQACRGERWMIVVNGQESTARYQGFVKNAPLTFITPTCVQTLGLGSENGPEFFVVKVHIGQTEAQP
jgi:hypothetical protein